MNPQRAAGPRRAWLALLALLLAAAGAAALVFFWPGAEDSDPSAEGRASAAKKRALAALPYTTWVPVDDADRQRRGVTLHRKGEARPGLNFVVHVRDTAARLLDMEGKELHRWRFGDLPLDHAELLPDGDVLAIIDGEQRVMRVALDSTVRWSTEVDAHHDLDITPGGKIHVLSNRVRKDSPLLGKPGIEDNGLVTLAPDGELLSERSVEQLLRGQPLDWALIKQEVSRIDGATGEVVDLFHGNTVEVLARDVVRGGRRLFGRGDVLLCLRNLNLVLVADLQRWQVLWSWGRGAGQLDMPHNPTLLPDGNILIFDNGYFRGHSRVLELDPGTGQARVRYQAEPPSAFFSSTGGASQPLPGGNILVTSTNQGRAFEVTPAGALVWEYYSAEIKEGQGRRGLWRITRLDHEGLPGWAEKLRAGEGPKPKPASTE